MSNFLSEHEKENVFNLALLSVLRGTDSSGFSVALTNKKGEKKDRRMFHTRRSMNLAPSMMLESSRTGNIPGPYELFLGNKESPVHSIIGHCRAATVGKVDLSNAHPHHVGKLIGTHNGTMKDILKKDEVYNNSTNKESDSFQIFKYIGEHGVQKFWETYHDKGAFALVWFDIEDSSLNVLRNSQRTLYWTGDTTMYYASERDFLLFALNRGSRNMKDSDIKPFDTGAHYKAPIWGDRKWTITQLQTPVPKWSPYKGVYDQSEFPFVPDHLKAPPITKTTSTPTTQASGTTNVIPFFRTVPNSTHHVLKYAKGGTRYINNKKLSDTKGNCSCDWCSGTFSVDSTIRWYLFEGDEQDLEACDNDVFLNKYALKLCSTCHGDSQVKETFNTFVSETHSQPIDFSTYVPGLEG